MEVRAILEAHLWPMAWTHADRVPGSVRLNRHEFIPDSAGTHFDQTYLSGLAEYSAVGTTSPPAGELDALADTVQTSGRPHHFTAMLAGSPAPCSSTPLTCG